MSTKTTDDWRNAVLQTLAEAGNSALAGMPSGTGTNGYAIDATAGMTQLLNEAKDELCKCALLAERTASLTCAIGATPNNALTLFGGLADCKTIRVVFDVYYAPTAGVTYRLTKLSPEAMENFYRDRLYAANAAPKYWANAKNDNRAVAIQARPDTGGQLLVTGYGLPADIDTGGNPTFAWLPADDEDAITLYAAMKLCEKASDDPRLAMRRAFIAPRLDKTMYRIRNRVPDHMRTEYMDGYLPYEKGAPAPEQAPTRPDTDGDGG